MEEWVNSPQITFFIVYQRKSGDSGREEWEEGVCKKRENKVVFSGNHIFTIITLLLCVFYVCVCIVLCGVWQPKASLLMPLFLLIFFPAPSPSFAVLCLCMGSLERGWYMTSVWLELDCRHPLWYMETHLPDFLYALCIWVEGLGCGQSRMRRFGLKNR